MGTHDPFLQPRVTADETDQELPPAPLPRTNPFSDPLWEPEYHYPMGPLMRPARPPMYGPDA